jgi:hypothetical protein
MEDFRKARPDSLMAQQKKDSTGRAWAEISGLTVGPGRAWAGIFCVGLFSGPARKYAQVYTQVKKHKIICYQKKAFVSV